MFRISISNISLCHAHVLNKSFLWGLCHAINFVCHDYMQNDLKSCTAGNLFGFKRCHAFWFIKKETHVKVRDHGNPNCKGLRRGNLRSQIKISYRWNVQHIPLKWISNVFFYYYYYLLLPLASTKTELNVIYLLAIL